MALDHVPLYSPLLEQAMRVAARYHRSQTRKSSDLPYITHPAGMAVLLARAGFTDDAVLAAALLHDTLEDTAYTAEELTAEFPPDVAEYVDVLSEEKVDQAGRKRPWRVRKEDHIAKIATAPLPARAIVLADKLHNLVTMRYDLELGQPIWDRFNAPPEDILWYHRAVVEAAGVGDDSRLRRLAEQCTEVIDSLSSRVT